MTDRPILFSAPMVRALLAGTKTQTRRALKPPYGTFEYLPSGEWRPLYTKAFSGDRLWVREAWRTERAFDGVRPRDLPIFELPGLPIFYEANDNGQASAWGNPWGEQRRPSMFMPRWASRLSLTVTDVRVERLQDISEEDALAEGIEEIWGIVGASGAGSVHREISGYRYFTGIEDVDGEGFETGVEAYAALWKHINGADSWGANPWVSATTFDVHQQNIDAMKEAA